MCWAIILLYHRGDWGSLGASVKKIVVVLSVIGAVRVVPTECWEWNLY
jgi:hypothetical protein